MKRCIFLTTIVLACVTSSAHADQVGGYQRDNGSYVQSYERSAPNGTVTDNYSYLGNSNPYTGQIGEDPYRHDRTSSYFNGPDPLGEVGHGLDSWPNPNGGLR